MANSDQQDLMSVGTHCKYEFCKRLDFLPFQCNSCKKNFCVNHFREHSCTLHTNTDSQLPQCPLCSKYIENGTNGRDDNGQVPKQWGQYLRSGKNKELLISFILKEWQSYKSSAFQGKSPLVTSGNSCWELKATDNEVCTSTKLTELTCDHEEADTRMLLHALHASDSANSVLIRSADTDVAVLCVAMDQNIDCDLLLEVGGGSGERRTLNIASIARSLGSKVNALIGFHAMTGCDSTSCFFGKSKRQCWKVLLENPCFDKAFAQIGDSDVVESSLLQQIEEFTCKLYKTSKKTVNECRLELFKRGKFGENLLPPNLDSLQLHIKRANYQAIACKKCLFASQNFPELSKHGWTVGSDGEVEISWMTLKLADELLVNKVTCKCKSGCSSNQCGCRKSEMNCSLMCGCADNCINRSTETPVNDEDSDSGDTRNTEEEVDFEVSVLGQV